MIFNIIQFKINSNKTNEIREYLNKFRGFIKSFGIDEQADLSTIYAELINSARLTELKELLGLRELNFEVIKFMFPVYRIDSLVIQLNKWSENGKIKEFALGKSSSQGEKLVGIREISFDLLEKIDNLIWPEPPKKLLHSERVNLKRR